MLVCNSLHYAVRVMRTWCQKLSFHFLSLLALSCFGPDIKQETQFSPILIQTLLCKKSSGKPRLSNQKCTNTWNFQNRVGSKFLSNIWFMGKAGSVWIWLLSRPFFKQLFFKLYNTPPNLVNTTHCSLLTFPLVCFNIQRNTMHKYHYMQCKRSSLDQQQSFGPKDLL